MTIACALTPAERRARRAQVTAIAERSLRARRRLRRGEQLLFDPAAEPVLRELVALEAECCPFLTFDLRSAGDTLELTITGPQDAAPLIAELLTGAGPRFISTCSHKEPCETCAPEWGLKPG